jgi:hypothetical protein
MGNDDTITYGPDGDRIHEEFSKILALRDRRIRALQAKSRIRKAREARPPQALPPLKLIGLLAEAEKEVSNQGKQILIRRTQHIESYDEIASDLGTSPEDVIRTLYDSCEKLTAPFRKASKI